MSINPRVLIMREFMAVTNEMLSNRNSVDALLTGAARRQQLMEDYQKLPEEEDLTSQELGEIKRTASEVIEKDKIINAALETFEKQSKEELAVANKRQKVIGYASQSLSTSGSYMDYRK